MHDKFNKNILVFEGENGEKDELRSYVVMPNAPEHIWVKERKDIPKGNLYEHEFNRL